jgi:3-isopropylmalate/(R)-2-methylmalate dehydratase large subunit
MAAIFWRDHVGADEKVVDPESIFFFRDHLTFLELAMTDARKAEGLLDVALELKKKQEEFAAEQGIKLYGELPRNALNSIVQGSEAICHSKMLERHVLPGQVVIGSDSHTPHSGAVGCVAFGVGTTAIFNSWLTKDVRLKVPASVLVRVNGTKPANVTAKDFMLQILRQPYVKSGRAIGKIVEYAGDAVRALSIDERATMTNMAAEVGAFTGIIAPDATTVEYLVRERGLPRAEVEGMLEGLFSDPDADYEEVIDIDASMLEPMIALPGDPGNGQFIRELGEQVKLDIAYAGSCTAGKEEDLDFYARVLREAVEAGRKVAPGVRMILQYGSEAVREHARRKGYLEIFERAGVRAIDPGCGACIGCGPGVSETTEQVTVSAINRNFAGRSGPGKLYLASPLTVAASAIEGRIVSYEPGMFRQPARV